MPRGDRSRCAVDVQSPVRWDALPALWSYDWSAALLAFPWQDHAARDEETEDYGVTYLRHMMTYNGKAQCMLAPDMIPQEAGK